MIAQHQGAIELVTVGALRVLCHHDMTLEHAAAMIVEHALVDLAAGGVGDGVHNLGGVIQVLLAARRISAVQVAVRPFALQSHRNAVSGEPAAGADHMAEILSLRRDFDHVMPDVAGVGRLVLQLDVD